MKEIPFGVIYIHIVKYANEISFHCTR